MSILFRNNAVSTLASGTLITDTAIVVQPGEGSRFPNPGPGQYFIITVQNGAAFEIMHCTARSNNVMTVVRAREGTLAQPWAADSSVTMRITAGCLNALAQQEQVDAELANRAPLNHTHTTAQVVGLDAALANRAPLNHTHTTAEVVGLAAELANRALLTGAAFSGDVTVAKATPGLILNKTASGQTAQLLGRTGGSNRWGIELGTATAESGGNAGSNFIVRRYDDSGNMLGAPVSISRASGAVTLEAPLTLPAVDPTNANHAARKAYVDAGDSWVKLADAAVTNSTIIDLTGFSLQHYRQVTLLLLGARLPSVASSPIIGQVYRNGLLVNTGYFFVRETAAGTGNTTMATTNNAAWLDLTFSGTGVNTNPMRMGIDIVQPGELGDVLVHVHAMYYSNQPLLHNNRVACFLNGGSGWTNGFRIAAPTAFQADVGRIVVLGLKP